MIFWEDVPHLDGAAALESAAAAFARMTAAEQAAERDYCRARRQAERAEWAARWPAHCRHCEGHGAHTVLVGIEDEAELEGELCEFCSSRGLCPRCGSEGFNFFRSGSCACGWEYGREGSAMPAELLEGGATDLNDYLDPFGAD